MLARCRVSNKVGHKTSEEVLYKPRSLEGMILAHDTCTCVLWWHLLVTPERCAVLCVRASQSLLLKWSCPPHDGGSPITGYKVEMRSNRAADNAAASVSLQQMMALPEEFVNIYSGPEMCVQVTDLVPGTAYEYRAAALNSQGAGKWSDTGMTSTLPAAPMAPAAPAVTAATSSSLMVSWTQPQMDHGSPVTSYTVNMARLGPVSSSSSGSSTTSSVHSSTPVMGNGAMENGHAEQHGKAIASGRVGLWPGRSCMHVQCDGLFPSCTCCLCTQHVRSHQTACMAPFVHCCFPTHAHLVIPSIATVICRRWG